MVADSFFLGGSVKKGKSRAVASKPTKSTPDTPKPKRKVSKPQRPVLEDDEELDEDVGAGAADDLDLVHDREEKEWDSEDPYKNETAGAKRLRLAKEYLAQVTEAVAEEQRPELEAELGGEVDAKDIDRELIASRLRNDVLESQGRLYRQVALLYTWPVDTSHIRHCRGHQLSLTSTVISQDEQYIYTASKDACIIQWDLKTGKKVWTFRGVRKGTDGSKAHSDHVLALACSSDGKYLASGGRDKLIHIWDAKERKHLTCFKQHRNAVSALVFRQGHNELYSGSHDRTIKLWNIDELGYIETLFGHQDTVVDLDALSKERCLSVGARDRSARLFKIVDETQLVFRYSLPGSLDVVRMIDDELFLTGGDCGTLALWSTQRKKPIFQWNEAHGSGSPGQPEISISAMALLRHTDLFATGSGDGFVRFWRLTGEPVRAFEALSTLPVPGFINGLAFTPSGSHLCIAVGQEPRLGRWARQAHSKNALWIVPLQRREHS